MLQFMKIKETTAPVERIFSQAGLCTNVAHEKLSDENLEREVFIRVNRKQAEKIIQLKMQ